jgi:hypothetical protein
MFRRLQSGVGLGDEGRDSESGQFTRKEADYSLAIYV